MCGAHRRSTSRIMHNSILYLIYCIIEVNYNINIVSCYIFSDTLLMNPILNIYEIDAFTSYIVRIVPSK